MMGGTIEKNNRRFKQLAEAQMYLAQMSQEVGGLPKALRAGSRMCFSWGPVCWVQMHNRVRVRCV